MNKTTKGALAVSAAGVLLLGGASSLAYWSNAQSLPGGTVTAGNLALTAPQCAGWSYATGGAAVNKFVPGDVISKTCTFVVKASGDNLKANLVTPASASVSGGATGTVAATYTIDAPGPNNTTVQAPLPGTIGSGDNNKTVTATIKVTFPFGTNETTLPKVNGNDTQDKVVTIGDLGVTLTQVN